MTIVLGVVVLAVWAWLAATAFKMDRESLERSGQ